MQFSMLFENFVLTTEIMCIIFTNTIGKQQYERKKHFLSK